MKERIFKFCNIDLRMSHPKIDPSTSNEGVKCKKRYLTKRFTGRTGFEGTLKVDLVSWYLTA